MSELEAANALGVFSDQLAGAVEQAGQSVVRVEGRQRQAASGIVWTADGQILTADHVIEREEDIKIGLPDGSTTSATLVGRDASTDVALLRISASGLRAINRGPAPKVGHVALLVARPGQGLATSIGVVSAIETVGHGQLDGVIRTDATFFPGFSGGPMINSAGGIVGLATSHFGRGSGLAIPLTTIDRVASTLLSHGKIKRGFLGVSSQTIGLPDSLRSKLDPVRESGLLIVGVEPNGPAERAGIIIGDILVALGGKPVRNTEDLVTLLGPDWAGQKKVAHIFRGGEPKDIAVEVGER